MAAKNTGSSLGLTPDQAALLLRADVQKAIEDAVDPVTKKLRKNLPPSIRRIVAQVAADGKALALEETNFAGNKSQLARRLGMTRPTLYKLLRKRDRPPDGEGSYKYDVTAWKLFAAKNTKIDIEGIGLTPKDNAQVDRANAQTRKILFELQVSMRDYLRRAEVNEAIDTANGVVVRELRKALEHELPPQLEGLTAAEIKREIKKALDEVFQNLPKAFDAIIPESN